MYEIDVSYHLLPPAYREMPPENFQKEVSAKSNQLTLSIAACNRLFVFACSRSYSAKESS